MVASQTAKDLDAGVLLLGVSVLHRADMIVLCRYLQKALFDMKAVKFLPKGRTMYEQARHRCLPTRNLTPKCYVENVQICMAMGTCSVQQCSKASSGQG